MSKLVIDQTEVNRLIKVIGSNCADILNSAALDVLSEAQRNVPVKTGELKKSGKVKKAYPKDLKAVVSFGDDKVGYAAMVEYGTGPHAITPKNKQALYWPGADHPVKYVWHPGTAAKPFLQPAVEKIGQKYNSGELWRGLVK
jgi:hypothetical protein